MGDAILSRIDIERRFGRVALTVGTTDYHVPRVGTVLSRVWGSGTRTEVCCSACDDPGARAEADRASHDAFERTFAGIAAGDLPQFVRRLTTAHLFYNASCFRNRPLPEKVPDGGR